MKEYPSILGAGSHGCPGLGQSTIAFKKYDGSNMRFEWSHKKGWHLFGTRRRLFDKTDPEYGCAIDIFLSKYASGLEAVIKKDKYLRHAREIICYGEFFGPWSFAGQHDPSHPAMHPKWTAGNHLCYDGGPNDPKDVVIFDVNVHKKGLMSPREFVDTFGHLPIAEIVYQGNMNKSFINDVREGTYTCPGWDMNIPLFEGVVCKGLTGKAPHGIWMAKIKTNRYLSELKRRFEKDWEQFGE